MKTELLEMALNFIKEATYDAEKFSDEYIKKLYSERKIGLIPIYENMILDGTLSSIFCLADNFNPDKDRARYELDADQLRLAIKNLLIINGFLSGEILFDGLPEGTINMLNSYIEDKFRTYP